MGIKSQQSESVRGLGLRRCGVYPSTAFLPNELIGEEVRDLCRLLHLIHTNYPIMSSWIQCRETQQNSDTSFTVASFWLWRTGEEQKTYVWCMKMHSENFSKTFTIMLLNIFWIICVYRCCSITSGCLTHTSLGVDATILYRIHAHVQVVSFCFTLLHFVSYSVFLSYLSFLTEGATSSHWDLEVTREWCYKYFCA